MEIATIVPTPQLGLVEMEPYQMALAHLLEHPWQAEHYNNVRQRGAFVLMDNGVVENGTPFTPERLYDAWIKISPHEVILPDCPGDADATLELGGRCLAYFKTKLSTGEFYRMRWLAVPQGKDQADWLRCAEQMLDNWDITCLGVSKLWCGSHYIGGDLPVLFHDRCEAMQELVNLVDGYNACGAGPKLDVQYHWLGVPSNPRSSDLQLLLTKPHLRTKVRGVDSGVATIYTAAGKDIENDEPKPSLDPDFHQALDRDLLLRNIAAWHYAVRYQVVE